MAQWLARCAIHHSVGRHGSCGVWILDRRNRGTRGLSRKIKETSKGLGRFVAKQIVMAPCRFRKVTLFWDENSFLAKCSRSWRVSLETLQLISFFMSSYLFVFRRNFNQQRLFLDQNSSCSCLQCWIRRRSLSLCTA